MEWDWQFLTPSSTPTTASFDCNTSQTPRHFQDAFSPYAEQNQHQHQHPHQHQHATTTAIPLGPALDFGDHNLYSQDASGPYAYPQDYGHQQQPLQPAFAPQPQANHVLAPAAPIGNSSQGMPPNADMYTSSAESNPNMYSTSVESFQMHTPPPTRGSSIKRRSQRTESTIVGTPSSMPTQCPKQQNQQPYMAEQRRPSEAAPVIMTQHDPSQSQFHFTHPSGSQLLDLHPNVTFAQPRPTNNVNGHSVPQTWNGLDDPFGSGMAQQVSNIPQEQRSYPNGSGLRELRRTGSQRSRQLSIDTNASVNYGGQSYTNHSSPVKTHATSAGVDPSLVYSSPSRPATSESMQSSLSSRPSSSNSGFRVPYQHSLSDPRQEIENARASRFKPQQVQFPPRQYAQSFPARPELQRSNTVGSLRSSISPPKSDSIQSGMLTRSNSTVNLPRRSSPLKRERANRVSLCSISETPKPTVRTSVVLKVDENGNARTETQIIESSPTKSLRDKYPTLWDDSDSDSDPLPSSRSTSQWPSRNSSLTHARGEERHAKVAKLDPPLEDLENLHLPRSNSSASLRTPSKAAYAAAAQLRRQTSAKKQSKPSIHARRNTLASLNSSFESLPSVDLSSSDDRSTQTDAGSALRHMMASRGSSNGEVPQQVQPDPIPVNSRKPPLPMMYEPRRTHQKSQSFAAPAQHYNDQGLGRPPSFPVDCAPMQPAFQSPTRATNFMAAPVFRCICNLPLDDGRGTVQCSYCAMYLHAACLGVDPQRMVPGYACNFCTSAVNTFPPNSAQSFPVPGYGIAGI